jgi:hypothetical protein
MVDWSASATPKTGTDSIWVADLAQGGEPQSTNLPTRGSAWSYLRLLLVDAVRTRQRVLIGLDFPYAYPAGFASALGLCDPAWRSIWHALSRRLTDDPLTNRNNRFDLASQLNSELGHHEFWGHPVRGSYENLFSTKQGRLNRQTPGLPEFRETELRARRPGSSPKSVWQLYGNGSVGSQALTGIPVVSRLRFDPELESVSTVWPFETTRWSDLAAGRPAIVHTEIWPSLIPAGDIGPKVRDEAQVISLAVEFQTLDRDAELEALFAAPIPVSREEGWILGVR